MEVLKDQKIKVTVENMDGTEQHVFFLVSPKIEIVDPSEFIFSSPFTLPKSAFSANRLNIDGKIAEESLTELAPKKKKEEKATFPVKIEFSTKTIHHENWDEVTHFISKEKCPLGDLKLPPVAASWTADMQDKIQDMMEEKLFQNPFHLNYRCYSPNTLDDYVDSVNRRVSLYEERKLQEKMDQAKVVAASYADPNSECRKEHLRLVKWLKELTEFRKKEKVNKNLASKLSISLSVPIEPINRFKTSVEKAKAIIDNLKLQKAIAHVKSLSDHYVCKECIFNREEKLAEWLEELVKLRKENNK